MGDFFSTKEIGVFHRELTLYYKDHDTMLMKVRVSFPSSKSTNFFSDNDVLNCIASFFKELEKYLIKYLETGAWRQSSDWIGTEDKKEWVVPSKYTIPYDYTSSASINSKLSEKYRMRFRTLLSDEEVNKYVEVFQDKIKKLADNFDNRFSENQKKGSAGQASEAISQNINKVLVNVQSESKLNQDKNEQQRPIGDSQKKTLTPPSNIQPAVSRVEQATPQKSKISVFKLPNAKVGVDYREHLLETTEMVPFEYVVTVSPPDVGLTYSREDGFISGKPAKACDIEITIKYRNRNLKAWNEWRCQIYANPDPSSLWKDLPTDPAAPYQKGNAEVGACVIGSKRIIAASQRGRSHSQEGKFRDDHFLIHTLSEEGWGIIAVADGAGSAKYSREGSKIACEVVVDNIVSGISSNLTPVLDSLKGKVLGEVQDLKQVKDALYMLLGGAGLKALNAIKKEAEDKQFKTKDYATTLIVSIVRKIEQGWFVGAFWVGDGGAGVYRKGESVHLLGEPDGGEFAGQTRFLTSTEIWESKELFNRVRYVVVDDFTSLVLMTDGVSDPKFETENNLKSLKHWDSFWDDLSQGVNFDPANNDTDKELLKWLDFWSPGNHDDRTIAILY